MNEFTPRSPFEQSPTIKSSEQNLNANEILLDEMLKGDEVEIMLDLKKSSPFDGKILQMPVEDFIDSVIKAGVRVISVVTKPAFGGSPELFQQVRAIAKGKMLIWKFSEDDEGLDEAEQNGAHATILVVSLIRDANLHLSSEEISIYFKSLVTHCRDLGMAPIVEVYSDEELDMAIESGAHFIAVNSRNLKDGKSNKRAALHLAERIPKDKTAMFFSNMQHRRDVQILKSLGIKAALVSTVLEKAKDPYIKYLELTGQI